MPHMKKRSDSFAEPPLDNVYEGSFLKKHGRIALFSVEFPPGQFDQRADSAEQCIRFLNENETPFRPFRDDLYDHRQYFRRRL